MTVIDIVYMPSMQFGSFIQQIDDVFEREFELLRLCAEDLIVDGRVEREIHRRQHIGERSRILF